tara:strand:+ start:296 stop:469 length:174 start_codon:yes stop_codon:yes gene_type:complete
LWHEYQQKCDKADGDAVHGCDTGDIVAEAGGVAILPDIGALRICSMMSSSTPSCALC